MSRLIDPLPPNTDRPGPEIRPGRVDGSAGQSDSRAPRSPSSSPKAFPIEIGWRKSRLHLDSVQTEIVFMLPASSLDLYPGGHQPSFSELLGGAEFVPSE